MRFLVNKDSSPAAKPQGTVSHPAAFSVLTLLFKSTGHQLGRIYQKPSDCPADGCPPEAYRLTNLVSAGFVATEAKNKQSLNVK